jgi:hypothetical protein
MRLLRWGDVNVSVTKIEFVEINALNRFAKSPPYINIVKGVIKILIISKIIDNFTERRLSYHLKNKQNINENIQRN